MRYDRIIDNAAFWNEKVGNVVCQVKWNCKYFHLKQILNYKRKIYQVKWAQKSVLLVAQ